MKQLNVKGLSFNYDNIPILKNIDFEVNEGEFIVLLGPNGAGKSTLIKVVSGIITSQSGSIEYFDKEINSYTLKDLACCRSIINQEVHFAFPFYVKDIIKMGQYSHDYKNVDIVQKNIDFFELRELSNRSVLTLSGGEKQRVLFARALSQEPKILFLDEAHANLDVYHIYKTYNKLKQWVNEKNSSIVAVLHDVNLALAYATRFIFLKDGKVIHDGDRSLFTKEILKDIYGIEPHITKNNDKIYIDFYEQN